MPGPCQVTAAIFVTVLSMADWAGLELAVMTSMSHHVWLHMLLILPVISSLLGVFPALDLAVTLYSFLFPW